MGPLIDLIPSNANISSNCLLNEIITQEGNWNLNLFQVWLLKDTIQHIRAIPPLNLFEGPDKISWCHTSSGDFTIKSAYKILKEDSWNPRDEKWKCACKLPGPQRVRFFFWTVLKHASLTMQRELDEALCLTHHASFVVTMLKIFCMLSEIALLPRNSRIKSYQVPIFRAFSPLI